ncbi:MAG: hypothetical protein ABJP45_04040 [Cyclobacteriaceae bacterium]
MKKIVTILLLLVVCAVANGQDQIITKAGDTIICKITRISSDYIHFQIDDSTGPIRSRIEKDNVLSYFQKEESGPTINNPVEKKDEDVLARFGEPIDSHKLRVGLNTGFTYQFGGYEGRPKSYTKQIRTLWNFGGELHYMVWSSVGIGVKYNRISTKVDDISSGFHFKEHVRFQFLALSVLMGRPGRESGEVHYLISGGLLSYRDDGTIDGQNFFERGETIGIALEMGYDFSINSAFAAGINLGLTIARINELDVPAGTITGTAFDVSRIDLTVGLRYLK